MRFDVPDEGESHKRFYDPSGEVIYLVVDGKPLPARPGESLAAALYAAGIRAWRISRRGEPRGLLCGMGVCFDCLVTVNGVANLRACQVIVADGMVVQTGLAGDGI